MSSNSFGCNYSLGENPRHGRDDATSQKVELYTGGHTSSNVVGLTTRYVITLGVDRVNTIG